MLSVTPEHLGLPSNLNELYEGGVFKSEAELENLIKLNSNTNIKLEETQELQ